MIKNMANYPSREHAPEKHATKNNRSKIPQKYNQSINALHEIKKYQDTTDLLIRIKPFLRLVKKIAYSYNTELKFQRAAIEALQEGSEAFLVLFFDLTNILATHANRVTILQRDIRLAKYIFDEMLPSLHYHR